VLTGRVKNDADEKMDGIDTLSPSVDENREDKP
jgi:hypothetical protein